MTKDAILHELAKYTQVLHTALETETCHDNRLAHLGHLGMAARMFVAVQLPDSTVSLPQIVRIESRSYGSQYPGDAAASMRAAWSSFHPHLAAYIARLHI